MRRYIPQWLAAVYCTLRRHPQKGYAAWADGIQVNVTTCVCGGKQGASVIPNNRKIRRGLHRRG